MRTTRAISISLPPAELSQARRLAKQTNRSLSGLFREGLKRLADEYTPSQRRIIDASIREGMEDYRTGRIHGPFASAEEASLYIERVAKRRAAASSRRPAR